MRYIYIDNYRGFSDAVVEIKDVNFFVGENSTGKTSFLGLLKLLSSEDFWFNMEIDPRRVGFGTFKDVLSKNTSNKNSFSVGYIYDAKVRDSDADNTVTFFLVTFVEKEGMPRISKITIIRNGTEITVKYLKDSIKYRERVIENLSSAEEFISKQFNYVLKRHKLDGAGFNSFDIQENMKRVKLPPIIALIEIQRKLKKDADDVFAVPAFLNDIVWLAPIRSKPKKTYDEFSLDFSPEGDHIPYLIKRKLDSKNDSFRTFLREFGMNSGLFDQIEIKNYGRGQTSPFELDVVLSDLLLSVSSVGYGVSQVLPVIVEMFLREKNTWFAIQQPEVHLHPRAQAAIGELIYNLSNEDKKRFLIETHSDYLIDRFRLSCRKGEGEVSSQILFFERNDNGNKVTSIDIDFDGNISSDQPEAYRDFFVKEEMDLLGL
jgi:AAA15 family ATPase/GTPase